jgi:hypothetical protein
MMRKMMIILLMLEVIQTTMGGHGTHVAGIIAAEKNGTGMMGIAYNASIMPIKIFKIVELLFQVELIIQYRLCNGQWSNCF